MATVLQLLQALNRADLPPLPDPAKPAPIPYAPVGNLGPLSNDTTAAFGALNPEPVPPAILPPLAPDMNFVNSYAGTPPTPPTFQQPTTLEKIAAVLSGIGLGPEYGAQLREERQRPVREYQAAQERYQARRTQGVELAERRAEREADRANRAASAQYEREYKTWLKKMDIRQDQADLKTKQAFDLLKVREQERIADEKQERQVRAQQERDARTIAGRLGTGPGAAPAKIAEELGNYYAKLTDKLSPAAENWRNAQARRAEVLAGRGAGGGTGGGVSKQTAKLVEEFNNARQNLITATARGDAKGQKDLRMRLSQLVKRLAGRPGVEAGYGAGQWPYVKVNGQLSTGEPGQQPTAPQNQQADPLGIR